MLTENIYIPYRILLYHPGIIYSFKEYFYVKKE